LIFPKGCGCHGLQGYIIQSPRINARVEYVGMDQSLLTLILNKWIQSAHRWKLTDEEGTAMNSSEQVLAQAPDEKSGGLFYFYRAADAKARRTFWACTGGFAMDAMDFMMFPLIIGTLISVWKISPATAGGVATVTLWCSAIGGWLAGYLADRIGRVRVMQLTILLFSAGSALAAFAQDPLQLTI